MGKVATTVMLCAASMLGSALIAGQGFHPDPLPAEEDASRHAECSTLDDAHERQDCLALAANQD
jgi:hypothetical protein